MVNRHQYLVQPPQTTVRNHIRTPLQPLQDDRNGYLELKKDKTRQKELYLEQKKKKETQLELLHTESISKQEEQSLYEDAKDHVEMTDEELLQSMYDQIEKVVVLDNENIFIQWKFKRFFDSSAKI